MCGKKLSGRLLIRLMRLISTTLYRTEQGRAGKLNAAQKIKR
jgi:hypothetical protein